MLTDAINTMLYFLQTRMAVFSAQHAKPYTGRKRALSLLGKWSTTSSPTASPATQTARASALSTTFLLGSRSELSHFTESTMLLLCPDPLSLLSEFVPFLQVLLVICFSLTASHSCMEVKCWGRANIIFRAYTVILGKEQLRKLRLCEKYYSRVRAIFIIH